MANDPRFEVFPERSGLAVDPEDPDGPPIEPALTGQFRWRFRGANAKIQATGGEGFSRREDASRAIHDFLDAVDPQGAGTERTHAPIIDVDE